MVVGEAAMMVTMVVVAVVVGVTLVALVPARE
jgi:hypothetical protein